MLQRIRELGVRLSIDDFGTGFSSFSYLLQYQIDRLKIDQSFVRQAMTDANAAAVVRTIIAMSHNLGIKVIAEGAETPEQMEFLLRRRCDEVQGFYFARPVHRRAVRRDRRPRIEAVQIGRSLPPRRWRATAGGSLTGAEALRRRLDDALRLLAAKRSLLASGAARKFNPSLNSDDQPVLPKRQHNIHLRVVSVSSPSVTASQS